MLARWPITFQKTNAVHSNSLNIQTLSQHMYPKILASLLDCIKMCLNTDWTIKTADWPNCWNNLIWAFTTWLGIFGYLGFKWGISRLCSTSTNGAFLDFVLHLRNQSQNFYWWYVQWHSFIRMWAVEQKRVQRKARAKTSPTELSFSDLSCSICNRQFRAKNGLINHFRRRF